MLCHMESTPQRRFCYTTFYTCIPASLTRQLPRTSISTIDDIHEANIVEGKLITLANRALVVVYKCIQREQIIIPCEGFASKLDAISLHLEICIINL
jgi:hypothetical protein